MYQIDLIESVRVVLRRLYPTAERFKRISSDAIRKKIDRLVNLGVLREEKVSKYHIISLRLNQTIVRVRDILRDLESLERIRISHTRKIRERIIIPWIRSLRVRRGVNYSRDVNGRLHRWGFRRIQAIIEYKAKLKGIRVVYVDPAHTSSLCPICGVKLSPNGHRVMKCKNCGFKADREVVGRINIRLKALRIWGSRAPK